MKIRNIKALAPFKGYVVTGITFEEVGAQIKLDFDKRFGPRCPCCHARLPRNKVGSRAVMDCPVPHDSIVLLTFPTVQGRCKSCERYVTTCPEEVHPDCHATWRLMRLVDRVSPRMVTFGPVSPNQIKGFALNLVIYQFSL